MKYSLISCPVYKPARQPYFLRGILHCVLQEEQERNRRILSALENEKSDLASRHEQLAVMLDQTKVSFPAHSVGQWADSALQHMRHPHSSCIHLCWNAQTSVCNGYAL